jgi:hypothetical protein
MTTTTITASVFTAPSGALAFAIAGRPVGALADGRAVNIGAQWKLTDEVDLDEVPEPAMEMLVAQVEREVAASELRAAREAEARAEQARRAAREAEEMSDPAFLRDVILMLKAIRAFREAGRSGRARR